MKWIVFPMWIAISQSVEGLNETKNAEEGRICSLYLTVFELEYHCFSACRLRLTIPAVLVRLELNHWHSWASSL